MERHSKIHTEEKEERASDYDEELAINESQ